MRTRRALLGGAATAIAALSTCAPPARAETPAWSAYDRPATYATVPDHDVMVPMRDGAQLDANVERPTAPGHYPVLVVQTPYNKDGVVNSSLGGTSHYLAQRGYVILTVDVRGTGGSPGYWDSFGPVEQHDGYDVVEWAAQQPWSSGSIGLAGPSYMGLNQLLTAAQHPPHLKAIFPIIPMADGYRDITYSGGGLNASFIPFWLGLVTASSLTPPGYGLADPQRALSDLVSHAASVFSFQTSTVLNAATGGDEVYDGAFWKTRSPLEVVDQVNVPAFVVGGLHDLFQRGEPLIYERLSRHVFSRLLMGPWMHITAGNGLPAAGVPASLPQIELRWFDHWLRGADTALERIPPVTQYVWGAERWETQPGWPDPRLSPQRMYLRGGGSLSAQRPAAPEASQSFLQQPLSGICTLSTAQWTAGLAEPLPCTTDDRPNEAFGNAIYTTPPLAQELRFGGPILADLWMTTSARDAALTVRVTDVDPSGASRELTTGWLAASLRAVDPSRSRFVRGQLVQPWHPFTSDSVLPVTAGQPTELQVEVFPTTAAIRPGHRLRVTVAPADFPHELPPLPQQLAALGGQDAILTDPQHASFVTLPQRGSDCAAGPAPASRRARVASQPARPRGAHRRPHVRRSAAVTGAGCAPLPLANLIRG